MVTGSHHGSDSDTVADASRHGGIYGKETGLKGKTVLDKYMRSDRDPTAL